VTIASLPKFLGSIGYQISLAMVLRWRASARAPLLGPSSFRKHYRCQCLKVSSVKNLKARRNRRTVLLWKQCARDAAFNHQLTYSRLVPVGNRFFLVCKGFFLIDFLIAIVQAYRVLPLQRTKSSLNTDGKRVSKPDVKEKVFVENDTCFTNEPSLVRNS